MLEEKLKKDLPAGGHVRLFRLAEGAQKSLADFMRNVVWGCELPDSDVAILKERFLAIGLDFEQELSKRGRPLPPSPKSVKTDYGDLAEVIGYYIETQIDGTDPKYVWARNIHLKTVSRVSLPGIDGIAIHIEDLDVSEPVQPSEKLTICEWKHTENETVVLPSTDAAGFISEISVAKLLQELKLISKNLRERGELNRSVRVYLLATDFEQKSKKVKLNCAILAIENPTCDADFEKHYIDSLTKSGWPRDTLCGNVVEVSSIEQLAKEVYEQLTH
ncbi:MAG: hypothetical protein ACYC46_02170 [Acidobacteriaceae bacterium]